MIVIPRICNAHRVVKKPVIMLRPVDFKLKHIPLGDCLFTSEETMTESNSLFALFTLFTLHWKTFGSRDLVPGLGTNDNCSVSESLMNLFKAKKLSFLTETLLDFY